MGWCSATTIMDAVVSRVEEAVRGALSEDQQHEEDIQQFIDGQLAPVVSALATALRDGDWDCIEEAADFDRFRQEMLGYDDKDMVAWYRRQLADHEDSKTVREYAGALLSLLERMGH
jgi:hypothetical protein